MKVNIALLTVTDTRTLKNDKSGSILVNKIAKAKHNLIDRKICKDNILIVTKLPEVKRKWLSKSWVPRILFAATVTMVLIDGYFRTDFVNSLAFIGDPFEMSILYAFSLIGILGVHESGHLIAAKKHKIRTTWPFFIPGVPVFGIPTFGALIQSKGLTINRDILFDVAIAGPIAGLVIAIIV